MFDVVVLKQTGLSLKGPPIMLPWQLDTHANLQAGDKFKEKPE